ncbi:MAG: ABC transporter substrate-binding protein [Hydrogenophaga sp.]|uniref:ABC transporter substrate-binding protein n=1 Tax=Hydrogenophaga sp. TaxID=1904254 RepID=UPI001D7BE9DE|nr:ABC transporter substrate-binding protein [Hydrogenophaga sp.]MBX3610593.1 ABC transporter substrate-binding protein [Hydrogenophaga sp.]
MIRRQFTQIAGAVAVAGLFAWSPAQAQEVVKIGYSGPLSGGAAQYGKNTLDGLSFAVDELNASGFEVAGKKVRFEVVALDDKYNPAETGINFQRLVQEHKTPVVMCPHSGGGFAIQTKNVATKTLLLSYTSVPQITERGNPLTLRIPPEFTSYIPAFVKHAMSAFGKKVAIANADHDYAKAWTKAFVPAWTAAGGEVVAENPMSYNRATDFYSGVSKVLAAKPDVLFIGGASEPTALVVKQARELGFKGGFIIIDQAKMDQMKPILGGNYAMLEGAIGVLPLIDDGTAGAKAFVGTWLKAYPGRDPASEMSLNYTAMLATAEAMKLAGTTTDAMAIRANLDKAFKNLKGSQNPHNLDGVDARGGSTAKTRVAVVENGKIKEVTLASFN